MTGKTAKIINTLNGKESGAETKSRSRASLLANGGLLFGFYFASSEQRDEVMRSSTRIELGPLSGEASSEQLLQLPDNRSHSFLYTLISIFEFGNDSGSSLSGGNKGYAGINLW